MNYQKTLEYLYNCCPAFQFIGEKAYKPGLTNTIRLDNHFHSPHKAFRTIHVGGTNGKGSTSHMLAAILQSANYKVGLYTSPHLIDFRERIRVNGICIEKRQGISLIDIDHDAGDFAHDGGDYIKLLDWLEETGRNYPIRIHSQNPVGVQNMRAIIRRNGWKEIF